MRIIAHIDMDAFFASIEERDRPRLQGLPIVVGADPEDGVGRGVVSTANYKAREYGIRSALPISTAWKFSEAARRKGLPPAVFLTVDGRKYGAVSRNIIAILQKYSEHVEQASVDEAYIDLSAAETYKAAIEICKKIKEEIKERERLTASIGLGPNKLIAKIASDRQKPDGLTVVGGETESVAASAAEKFLEPLSIRTIPGVGPKAEEKFKQRGVKTIKDAKRFLIEELEEMMGKWGADLYERLRGRSDAPLVEEWEAKSVGEQETFMHDTRDPAYLREHLQELAQGVHESFKKEGFETFRAITITVRFADFKTFTRSATLVKPDGRSETLQFEALRLFMPFLDSRENPSHKAIRLIGVRVEKLA